MQAFYRNKTSKIIVLLLLFASLVQIITSLHRNDYIFLWIGVALATAFLTLLIITIFQPYVVLTSNTLRIRPNPLVMREYPLDRLQFYKKGVEFTLFTYTGEKGVKDKVKLNHLALDQDDLATIMAALQKTGGTAVSKPAREKN